MRNVSPRKKKKRHKRARASLCTSIRNHKHIEIQNTEDVAEVIGTITEEEDAVVDIGKAGTPPRSHVLDVIKWDTLQPHVRIGYSSYKKQQKASMEMKLMKPMVS